MLELVLLLLLILAITLIAYRGAVHEYEILQHDFSDDIHWSDLMAEGLPIVIRNIPMSALGGWICQKHENRPYPIRIEEPTTGKKYGTTMNTWLTDETPFSLSEPLPVKIDGYSTLYDAGFFRWYYLPFANTQPYILKTNHVHKLKKVVAEFSVITVTDGSPIIIWLAHEGAIGDINLIHRDPWTITIHDEPRIGDVKYIEIRIRSLNTIAIPKHWYYALQNNDDTPSWFTITELHSPVSRLVKMLKTD